MLHVCSTITDERETRATGTNPGIRALPPGSLAHAKRAYSIRRVDLTRAESLICDARPSAGDLVLARVTQLGHHQHLESAEGRRCRLWINDDVIVAYGARYAPDQFEAVVPDDLSPCHLVAGGGIAARVLSRHSETRAATMIEPLGLLADEHGVLNVSRGALGPAPRLRPPVTVAVVGTSMNAGKTTTAASLVRGLVRLGRRVGAAKITGTGAGGDRWQLTDAGASPVLDFTDSGYATTAGLAPSECDGVLEHLSGHVASTGAECLVLEVADGLLQRETAGLLRSHVFHKHVDALVFAAVDAMGAIAGVESLQRQGHTVACISGLLTAAPLAMREAGACGVPVIATEKLSQPEVIMELLPTLRALTAPRTP